MAKKKRSTKRGRSARLPKRWIEELFPALKVLRYRVTSEPSETYNCIAWAAGDSTRWWWPAPGYYWPLGVPRNTSLPAFVVAFESLGYPTCETAEPERGYEKVAIYALGDMCKHAARQLSDGQWSSKLGQGWDIAHPLEGVEGEQYGRVAAIMRRLREESKVTNSP